MNPCFDSVTIPGLKEKYAALVKTGMSEIEAGTKVVLDHHKILHDRLNKLKGGLKLAQEKYTPVEPPVAPVAQPAPPKSVEKKEKLKKLFGDLDDLIGPGRVAITGEFDKDRAEKIALKGAEIVGAYIDYGVTRFAEIAKEVYQDYGEDALRKFLQALKAGYARLHAERDDLDDMKEVRAYTVENLIESFKNGNTPTLPVPPGPNAPDLVGGQPAPGVGTTVPAGETKKLPGTNREPSPGQPGTTSKGGTQQGGGVGGRVGGPVGTPPVAGGTPSSTPPTTSVEGDTGLPGPELNHQIAPGDVLVPPGEVGKIRANLAAIKLVKQLYTEDRNATPEEKKTLAQFVGWGGLAPMLDRQKFDNEWDENWNKKYAAFHKELAGLLTEEEFQAAVNSTINAHYTARPVITALWDLARKLGFTGGNVLEPSAGVGHFFGLMPADMMHNSQLRAYELDKLTGQILAKLYPQATVRVAGYEHSVEPNNSQDLVITNVPFGAKAPFDKKNPDIGKFSLHNYFMAKGIRQLKPGGLGIFITSSSSLDNVGASVKFREWTTNEGNADFIGAIRLPNNAFAENAGTQVTTDILIYRKRTEDQPSELNHQYRNVVPIADTHTEEGAPVTIDINEYFANRQDMMLGEMKLAYQVGSGGLYSADSQTLHAPKDQDTAALLKAAIDKLPANIFGALATPKETKQATGAKEGSLITKGGKTYLVENGELIQQGEQMINGEKGKKYRQAEVIGDYDAVKTAVRELLKAEQGEQATDEQIEELRSKLNSAYDKFKNKYGYFNRNRRVQFLEDDSEHSTVFSLEDVRTESTLSPEGKISRKVIITKVPIFSKRVNFPVKEPTTAENVGDGLSISLSYRNKIDIPYIATMTGLSEEHTRQQLLDSGLAYENPQSGLLEDADTYLSGFVRTKLREAEAAGEGFEKNVEALKKVVPKDLPASLIEFKLGSTWMPPEFIMSWLQDALGVKATIAYHKAAGSWVTALHEGRDQRNRITYASGEDFTAFDLVSKALNLRDPEVTFTIKNPDGSKSTVKDAAKTAQAQAKMEVLADMFYNYVRDEKEFHPEMERLYNDVYKDFIEKKPSLPAFVHYPGSNEDITLRLHQRTAVNRALHESTLLAHEVGTGKTYTMITIAMEWRRLGIARKPMMVVHNPTLEQFRDAFIGEKGLYPGANILVPTKKDMDAKNRQKLFNKIAYGDWDAVIIPRSFLDFIPDDEERVRGYLIEQLDELKAALAEAKENKDRGAISEVNRAILAIEKQLDKVGEKKRTTVKDEARQALGIEKAHEKQAARRRDDVLNFESMGVDALFLDEAHEYKKLGFLSKMARVKGIDIGRSQRALGAFMKVRWIQEKNKRRNVVLATGTPITNTMAEVWTMMKFVAPDILEKYNITTFDEFASTFGQVEPSLEFTAAGKFKIVKRFKSYINAPELLTAFRARTDVVLTEDIPEFKESATIPKLKVQPDGKPGYTQVILKQTAGLKEAMQAFKQILERWEKLTGKEKRALSHIPLVVFNRAKQAAIDLRLLDPKERDDPGSKTNAVVKEAKRIYDESAGYKGTQLIFSDMYQSPDPGDKYLDEDQTIPNPAYGQPRFNLFHDLRDKLIKEGVKPEEIAIFQDYEGERRKILFQKVIDGEVRVMLGGAAMGVGLNVQDRLVALHHMDAPPRPMDFAQRNGRILRQGNLHATMDKPVEILTYGVEKTLDATAYQRLAFKQKFINQMMKAEGVDRIMSDDADEDNPSDMTFTQMMANLSGSQFAMIHAQKLYELRKLKTAQSNRERSIIDMNQQIRHNESLITALIQTEKEYKPFQEELKKKFPDNKITSVNIKGVETTEKMGEALQGFLDENFDILKTKGVGIGHHATILVNGVEVQLLFHKDTDWFNSGKMEYFVKQYNIYSGVPRSEGGGANGKSVMADKRVTTGAGLLTSMAATVSNFVDEGYNGHTNINTIPTRIAERKKDNAALEVEINKPFDKSDKLTKTEAEIADLEEKMKAENIEEPPEQKPPDEEEGEQAMPEHTYASMLGSPKKKKTGRLSVSPIYGGLHKQLKQIVIDLSKVIPAKIFYTKRPVKRRVLGLYMPRSAAIAIKYQGDLDTTAHELGHSLDDIFDLIGKAAADPKVEKELLALGVFTSPKSANNTYKINEGMAEFIRAWLVNPDKAEMRYPATYKIFEANVPQETRAKIRSFGDDIRRWAGLTGHEQVMSNVQFEPEKGQGWYRTLFPSQSENFELTWLDRLGRTWTNSILPFDKSVPFLLDKQQLADLTPAKDPRILVRLLAGGNDKVAYIIKKGFMDPLDPITSTPDGKLKVNRLIDPVSKQAMNFDWLLAPLDNSSERSIIEEQREVISYMIAKRTQELEFKLLKSDRITGIGAGVLQDITVANKRIEEHDNMAPDKQKRIEEAARRYKEYASQALEYAVAMGRMNAQDVAEIQAANLEYVALNRLGEASPDEEIVTFTKGDNRALGAVHQIIHKAHGSTKTIQNPYQSLMDNIIHTIKESDRNNALLAYQELFTAARSIHGGDPKYLASVARRVNGTGPNTITIFDKGKAQYWQMDEDIYKAIKNITENIKLSGWLTAQARVLRWGVTRFPIFAVRNRIRDFLMRMVISDTSPWKGFDIYLSKELRKENKDALHLFGGGQAGYYMLGEKVYQQQLEKTVRELAKDKRNILTLPGKMLQNAGDWYYNLIASGEMATRSEEYRSAFKAAKAKGLDDYNAAIFAAFKARDLLDFAVAGEQMKWINQIIPFTNAAAQGLRKVIKSFKEDPGGFAIRFMLYSLLPALLCRMMAHWDDKDEEYENLPDYRRDLFYNFHVGPNLWITIPKPFEVGVFGSGGERLLSYYLYGEKDAMKGYAGSVARSITPVDDAALAGPARSLVEVMANYDFFRNQHIIPTDQEGRDMELRNTESASRLAKAIAAATGALNGPTDPRYIDYIAKATAGYVGEFALELSDLGREDSRHKLGWTATGLLRNDPVYESKDVQELMDNVKKYGIDPHHKFLIWFNLGLNDYFDQTDPALKEEAGKQVRDNARFLNELLESNEFDESVRLKSNIKKEAKKP